MEIKQLKKKHSETEERFNKWTKVNPKQIDNELAMNSSRLFSVGLKKGEAEFLMEKSKAILKQTKAKVKMKWSKKDVGGKKLTIPQLDAKVDNDPEVIQAEMNYIEAQYVFRICESAFQSMKEKGDNIRTLAYSKGAELKHNYVKESKEERVKQKVKNQK